MDIKGALPSTADVVAGRAKREFSPFILFIHVGEEERRKMNRDTWLLFYEKLCDKLLDLNLEGKEAPTVEWHAFSKGFGLICPVDETSRDLLKGHVREIVVADFTFRAWARGEEGKYLPVTTHLPECLFKAPPGKILQAAMRANNFPLDSFVVRDCKKANKLQDSKVRLLRFGATRELVEALQAKNGRMAVAAVTLELRLKGEPMRQQ